MGLTLNEWGHWPRVCVKHVCSVPEVRHILIQMQRSCSLLSVSCCRALVKAILAGSKVLNDCCSTGLIHPRDSTVVLMTVGFACFIHVAISQRAQAASLHPCFAKCRERDRFQISHKVCEIHQEPLHLANCEVLRNLVDELRIFCGTVVKRELGKRTKKHACRPLLGTYRH